MTAGPNPHDPQSTSSQVQPSPIPLEQPGSYPSGYQPGGSSFPQMSSPLASGWANSIGQTIAGLGTLIDSWADLVDDHGEKTQAVTQAFQQRLAVRQLPQISLEAGNVTPGQMFSGNRFYQLVRTRTGATVAVRIDRYGRDLFLTWDLWVRLLPNWPVILVILGLAAFLGFGSAPTPDVFGPSQFSMFLWIASTIVNVLWMSFLVGLAGRIIRGNWIPFFVKQLSPFDVDDITAAQLAVHNSILEAVDMVGIDAKLLRVKETFRGGQRERLI